MLFPGDSVAADILAATKALIQEQNITPGLGVILVGDDAPSHLYVGIKEKKAEALGIYFEKKVFTKDASQQEVEQAVLKMNANEKLHGIIVQLPLPEHFDTESIINTIEPQKDTDGFHPLTIEKFLAGDVNRLPVFPRAMMELVRKGRKEKDAVSNKALAIVNSDLMGRVLVGALTNDGFEAQYVFGSEKENMRALLSDRGVVLTAVGTPNTFSTLSVQGGAIIIDGGIFYDEKGRVVGDVTRDDGVYREDILVTPVPGGVGPVTVAVLLARVTETAIQRKI